MSWVKIDDKAWSHPKMVKLPAGALKLWLFGLCWSNDQETDGRVSSSVLTILGGGRKSVDTLCAAGLWAPTDEGWQIVNFLKYQPSKAEKEAKRAAAAERIKRHRNGVTAPHVTPLHPRCNAVGNAAPVPTRPDPSPKKKEISPPPDAPHHPPESPGAPHATSSPIPRGLGDEPTSAARFAGSLEFSRVDPGQGATGDQNAPSAASSVRNHIPHGLGGDARKRPDVLELHALWQATFGLPPTKFRGGYSDQSAETLALAIDAGGLEACKLALKHAPTEPGVKGELDGTGNVHFSISYLFGNENTLPRLLKHAEARERRAKPAKMTKSEALLKLASLPPDSEEANRLREKLKRAEEHEQSSWQPSSVMGSGLR